MGQQRGQLRLKSQFLRTGNAPRADILPLLLPECHHKIMVKILGFVKPGTRIAIARSDAELQHLVE